MDLTSWLMAFLIAALVFAGYMALLTISGRKESLRDRVQRLASGTMEGDAGEVSLLSFDEEKTSLAAALDRILSLTGVNMDQKRKELQLRMTRAGIVSADGLVYYVFLKRIGLPIIGGLATLFCLLEVLSAEHASSVKLLYLLLTGFSFAVAGWGADLYVNNCTLKRKKVLERSFPDALDLLLVCVESGLALDGALSRVTRELGRAHPEITNELNRTRLELTLLNDRTVALQNLAERTDLVPFRSLVSTLIQTEKFGTSLSDTLRVLSEDYRLTRLMIAENKAGRLPTLMTIPLILLLLPALGLVLIGPPIIRVAAQGGIFGEDK